MLFCIRRGALLFPPAIFFFMPVILLSLAVVFTTVTTNEKTMSFYPLCFGSNQSASDVSLEVCGLRLAAGKKCVTSNGFRFKLNCITLNWAVNGLTIYSGFI